MKIGELNSFPRLALSTLLCIFKCSSGDTVYVFSHNIAASSKAARTKLQTLHLLSIIPKEKEVIFSNNAILLRPTVGKNCSHKLSPEGALLATLIILSVATLR